MLLDILTDAVREFAVGPANHVAAEDALRPELAGLRIYYEPLLGAAAAEDPLFAELRRPEVLHPEAMLPEDWLFGARSVLSFFLPFTKTVRSTNCIDPGASSDEWLHARIEGQMAIAALGESLCAIFEKEGYSAVFPTADRRFRMLAPYTTNWSERHVAHICGLGSFGLSKGLITAKGIAGRFGSIITDAALPVTERKYSAPYDYCTMCGACQRRCPAGAIDGIEGRRLWQRPGPMRRLRQGFDAPAARPAQPGPLRLRQMPGKRPLRERDTAGAAQLTNVRRRCERKDLDERKI